jgi:ATP-dependent DNA helicase RecG
MAAQPDEAGRQYWAPAVVDAMPESVRNAARVMPLGEALLQVHFPDSQEKLKAARERLAFDEIFYLQMGVLRQKRDWKSVDARRFSISDEWLEARLKSLPFTLTSVQQSHRGHPRRPRLGGTHEPAPARRRGLGQDRGRCALAAAMITSNGSQAAIMAPTSILAEQHYRNFVNLLKDVHKPEEIRLLVGDTPDAEKEEIRSGLENNTVRIVIGTHASSRDPSSLRTCSSSSSTNSTASASNSAPNCAARGRILICS